MLKCCNSLITWKDDKSITYDLEFGRGIFSAIYEGNLNLAEHI